MRSIGRIVATAAAGTMALGLAACSTSTSDTGDSKDTGGTKDTTMSDSATSDEGADWEGQVKKGDGSQTIYLVSKGFQHRFWQAVKEGAEEAGEEYGYKVEFVGPQNEQAVDEQSNQLNTALQTKPAAIGFAALNSQQSADTLQKIKDANIPVVAFDSGVESDIPVTTVSTDNFAAAEDAAKHMIELLKGKKGSVGVVCHDDTSATGKDRCNGFKEYFKKNAPGDLKLLDPQVAGEQTKAADTAKSIIQANPDVVGMYGSNEAAATGVVNGVAELGQEVTIVGFDSGKPQQDAIKSGTEAGAITQAPKKMGYLTVKAAIAAVDGVALPKKIDSGFAWYDKSNIESDEVAPNLYE